MGETMRFFFFCRCGENPGITVSKKATLPSGDFEITEYIFQRAGYVSLWFIDRDKFTADERELAYKQCLDGEA